MTQTEAARLTGLSQPAVSRLLRGDFREYSLERLFRLLNALGRDIVIRQPRPPTAHGCASPPPNPPDRFAGFAGHRRSAGVRLSLQPAPNGTSRRPALGRTGHVPPARRPRATRPGPAAHIATRRSPARARARTGRR